jgi:hypothetical protein
MTFGVQRLLPDAVIDAAAEIYQMWDHGPILDEIWDRVRDALIELGANAERILNNTVRSSRPLIARSVYAVGIHTLEMPAVQAGALSATEPLADNYLADIRTTGLEALRDRPLADAPRTLLYYAVRHAKLSAYARAIYRSQFPTKATYLERELYDIDFTNQSSIWDRVADAYPESPRSYAQEYDQRSATGTHADPDLVDFDTGLEEIEGLPTERLDLLFRETLSLTDNRLDAWITAFATKRLASLRAAPGNGGTYVGGYGWLYDLKVPPIEGLARIGDGTEPSFDPTPDSVGYVPAPSVDQAKTAALLRSGHQARADEDADNPFAIDLSSERVRLARELLDGVREGQPLGALLGYRFERQLQERRLGAALPVLRNAYPLVAGKKRAESAPADAVAAASVVDGLALVRALRTHADTGGPHWIPHDLLTDLEAQEQTALQEVGEAVERVLDAVGDATITESVFQTLRGNSARAGAALDAVAGGDVPPPELESLRTPRSGRNLSHRVFVALQDEAAPARHPRAQAAPQLNSFCASVLGDPSRCVLDAVYRHPDGSDAGTRRIRLDVLGLDPIDLMYLAATDPGGQSDLELLLRDYLLRERPVGVGPDAEVELRMELSGLPPAQTDLANLLELARALHGLVGSGRPLADEDLLQVGEESGASPLVAELEVRADAALAAFSVAPDAPDAALDADPPQAARLRAALFGVATFGVPGSIPVVPEDSADAASILTEQARTLMETLQEHRGRLQALENGPEAAASTVTEQVAFHTGRLKQVFGAGFQVLMTFVPTHAAAIAAGLGAASSLLDGDPEAPEQFLAQLATVRSALARLQRLRDYTEALAPERALPLAVAQLPFAGEATRWGALPGAPAGHGAVALLALQAAPWDATRPFAGLFVDAWDEAIPADTQTTGLAFNFNAPNSEPPNAILLATPADPGRPWSTDELLGTVKTLVETLPYRGASYKLKDLGQYLPAAFFAYNTENDTVSTDFSAYLD